MLGSFKKHPRRNRFELKLRKTKIKFYSWWNKFHYGGGPNDDPTILTRRPRHIPFISLRNDEYSEFLKIEENRSQRNIFKTGLPSYRVYVKNFDHNKAINQVLQNQCYISRRLKQKKPKSKKLGFSIYQDNFNSKQSLENNLKLNIVNTAGNIDDSTLSSFEHDLMSFALEDNRDKLLPFGKPAKSRDKNNCFNEDERDDDFNYSSKTIDIYHHQMDNVKKDKYEKEAHDEENKENNTDSFLKLIGNKDRTNSENIYDINNELCNWVNNKLLLEENEIVQPKHGEESQNLNKFARIPMIQRPEFFEKELKSEYSKYSILDELSTKELERFQAQNHLEENQSNKKQRKKPMINNKSTRMRLEILKGNTIERISSLISSLPSFRSTWAGKSVSACLANKNVKEVYPDLHYNIINDLSLSAAKMATGKIYGLSTSKNNHNNSNADLSSFNNFEDPLFFGNIRMGEEILTVKKANKLTGKTYAENMINQTKKNKKIIARTPSGRKILGDYYPLMPEQRLAVNLLAEVKSNDDNGIDYVEKTSGSEFDIIASYQQLSG